MTTKEIADSRNGDNFVCLTLSYSLDTPTTNAPSIPHHTAYTGEKGTISKYEY